MKFAFKPGDSDKKRYSAFPLAYQMAKHEEIQEMPEINDKNSLTESISSRVSSEFHGKKNSNRFAPNQRITVEIMENDSS